MSPDAARILADLHRHARAFDLTEDTLGERLCQTFTDGVAATIAAEQAPDGTRWDELSLEYAERKAKVAPGKAMAHLHDLMADPTEIAGDVIVFGPDAAFVTYGTSPEARAEAAAFQEGDPAQNRPARPFWGFTASSSAATAQLLADRLKAVVG